MSILVTGASGFIGRVAVAQLRRSCEVEVVTASRRPLAADHAHRHIVVDLLKPGAGADLIKEIRPSRLLHLAWNAAPGRFWTAADNLDWGASTLSLVRAFIDRGGRRAVVAGSCAEYDWTGPAILAETTPRQPATLYGRLKDATQRAVCAAGEQFGTPIAWGRIFWLYGPGEARGRLVSDVCAQLARGEPVEVGDGLEARDFMHVDDVAGALTTALAGETNGPFNIGSGVATPVRRIVETLASFSGRSELVRFGARRKPPGVAPELAADISRLKESIGFVPAISLTDGLAETYQWWRATTE